MGRDANIYILNTQFVFVCVDIDLYTVFTFDNYYL